MDVYRKISSPVGDLFLLSDGENLTGVWMSSSRFPMEKAMEEKENLAVLDKAEKWFESYFSGGNPTVDFPLHLRGTRFQKTVWQSLLKIPYGKTVTYGDIARDTADALGKNNMSARAVGVAIGRNPIAVIIPCHRVVGKNGSLTGYGGGISNKIKLLQNEGVDVSVFTVPDKGTAL